MVPAVAIDGLAGSLVVLIIAEHDIESAGQNLTWHVGGIGRIDLHLHVGNSLTAGAWGEVVIVLVADDRCALGSAVAHGIGEVDALEELLNLLVQGCTANDDLVKLSAEGLEHFLADHLAYLLRDDGHLQQQAHAVVLDLREYLLTDDFLDDQRYGDNDDGLDLGQRLSDDSWRGHTIEIIDMTTVEELEDELEGHAVHVGHGQHRDDTIAGLDGLTQHLAGKVVVRPQGAIGQHDAFGEARSSTGIVDQCQFVGILLVVVIDMLFAEVFWELLAVELVEVLAGIGEFISTADHQRVVGVVDDTFERRHLHRIDDCGHVVANKEQAGLRVVYDIVDARKSCRIGTMIAP